MFNLDSMLTLQRTLCGGHEKSKKRLFEHVSEIISGDQRYLEAGKIFASLNARERLGSTAIGHGIAVPHCRINNCSKPIGTLITLDQAIDFDSPDGAPVDIVFVLLVPQEAHQDHLNTLASLAKLFSTPNYCAQLRKAENNQILFNAATSFSVD
jgi:PTS system nitrogen regulatory IIA component